MEITVQIISSTIAMASGAVAAKLIATDAFQRLVRRREDGIAAPKPYSERLSGLTESLTRASREVDAVLVELSRVAGERAGAVQQLEIELARMEGREKDLKHRIDVLEKTPLAVAEHFAKLVAPGEKRSAMRDYLLFGAGVVVSTAIGIAIQVFLK